MLTFLLFHIGTTTSHFVPIIFLKQQTHAYTNLHKHSQEFPVPPCACRTPERVWEEAKSPSTLLKPVNFFSGIRGVNTQGLRGTSPPTSSPEPHQTPALAERAGPSPTVSYYAPSQGSMLDL